MNLLAHWPERVWFWRRTHDGALGFEFTEPSAATKASGLFEHEEYVPASQLEGAVAAREALANAKELLERHLLAYEHADDVLSEIDAAIDSLGGQ